MQEKSDLPFAFLGVVSYLVSHYRSVHVTDLVPMHICFILSPSGNLILDASAETICGCSWALQIARSPQTGPWYPSILEHQGAEGYSFLAGRTSQNDAKDAWPDWLKGGQGSREFGVVPDPWPDGNWLALTFDPGQDILRAASDPFLFQRWYYGKIENRWYLSNSLIFLFRTAKSAFAIDWRQASPMLLMGYLFDKWTPLEGVFSLRSGEELMMRGGECLIKRRSTLPITRNLSSPITDLDQAAEQSLRLIRASVANELEGVSNIWLPLSGGLDSRMLLGCALEILPPEAITTYTFGHPYSLDFRIGTGLAKHLGIRNVALPMDDRPPHQQIADNFPTSEGVYWTVPTYPQARLRDVLPTQTHILSGYIGDVVFGSYELSPTDIEGSDPDTILLKNLRKIAFRTRPESVLRLLDTDDWGIPNIENDMLAIDGDNVRERVDHWLLKNHQMNRTNFAIGVVRERAFYRAPFIHRSVLKKAYQFSSDLRHEGWILPRMLERDFPALYAYPTKRNSGFSLSMKSSPYTYTVRAIRKALIVADSVLGPRFKTILYRDPRLNYRHLREYYGSPYRDLVAAAIEELSRIPAFRRKALLRLREDYLRRQCLSEGMIFSMLTLHQWTIHYGRL